MKTRVPVTHCPHCGTKLDAASSLFDENAKPASGDLTVCIKCATILRFTPEMYLVVCEDEKLRHLPAEIRDQLQRTQWAVMRLRGQMN